MRNGVIHNGHSRRRRRCDRLDGRVVRLVWGEGNGRDLLWLWALYEVGEGRIGGVKATPRRHPVFLGRSDEDIGHLWFVLDAEFIVGVVDERH
jgi:hypothetical protein